MPDHTLTITRHDGELVEIDGLAISHAFFTTDPSSVGPDSYDAKAGTGAVNAITHDDITTMNTTMRTRSKHEHWDAIIHADLGWLAAIPTDLDLIDTDDEEWTTRGGDELLQNGFGAIFRPHIGLARGGKMLHLKRPLLFPVLDRLVGEMLGVPLPDQQTPVQRAETARTITELIRREGRQNLVTLRAIQHALHADGITRSLARVMDASLWFSHPAASAAGTHRQIQVALRP